jgi:AcrR family transcriptional regulator
MVTSARAARPPRRLTAQARRDQLVAAAMPLIARRGPADLSLDEVAMRVDVTRNLLYHYFPAGRADLLACVVEEAEHQLLGPWRTAPPGADDLKAAVSRVLDHALAPTHAWRIHRMARATALPPVSSIIDRSTQIAVDALLLRADAPASPVLDVALRGYVAFAEAALDGARAARLPRPEIRRLLERMFRAVLAAQ